MRWSPPSGEEVVTRVEGGGGCHCRREVVYVIGEEVVAAAGAEVVAVAGEEGRCSPSSGGDGHAGRR
jgi:hypothetical protein